MKKLLIIFVLVFLLSPLFFVNAACLAGADPGTECLSNPLGDNVSIPSIIGNVINAILGLVGSLALAMFIYGGFVWMLSAGSQEKVTKGKNILVWATIGLVVIFSSYAAVKYIILALANR